MSKNVDVQEFASDILEMEKEALKNINKVEDKQMITRIIKKFEEEWENDDNK